MVAQKNEKHLKLTKKDENGKVNWIFEVIFLKMSVKPIDMILSSPPYIRTAEIEEASRRSQKLHDPFSALDGEEDGYISTGRLLLMQNNS